MDIVFSSTRQLAGSIRAERVSAVEVLEAHLAMAKALSVVTGEFHRTPGY